MILDTHVVVWLILSDVRLRQTVRQTLVDSTDLFSVSVASLWETEIKQASGRSDPAIDFSAAVATLGLQYLSIDAADAIRAARLPPHHNDPFDRMVIAQALNRGLTIVTHDRIFAPYDVPVLWT